MITKKKPLTQAEYQAAIDEFRAAENEWKSLVATEKQAHLAVEAAREPYYAKACAFRAVEKEWGQQQMLTSTQRNWLTALLENPKYIGGWRHRESSKTENRMRELGFVASSADSRHLVVTDLGKAKLAEPVPVKRGRKK